MQIVVLLLLVLALALLVLGLISGSTPLVVASIAASLAAAYAMVSYRRRRETAVRPPEPSTAEIPVTTKPPVAVGAGAALSADGGSSATAVLGRHADPASAEAAGIGGDDESFSDDEPAAARTDPPLDSHPGEPVWVIDGRPRYHLSSCIFIIGRRPEPVALRQAVEDGFTPCAQCDPDTGLTAG
jgi:hypothetical protein